MTTPAAASVPTPTGYVPRNNTLAIIALVAAFIIPVGGIIIGAIALGQIRRSGEEGHGLALAGVIVGIVGTVAQATFFILWAALFFGTLSQSGFPGFGR